MIRSNLSNLIDILLDLLDLALVFSRSSETFGRREERLVRDELGGGVQLETKSGFIGQVDSAVEGQDLVQEQVAERWRDGSAVRRVCLSWSA
jgi:hypothetical protein